MSILQRLCRWIVPAATMQAMEAESRQWILTCPHCATETSVWDLGGIRWKATGNPRRYGICAHCRKQGWHLLHKQESAPVLDPHH